MELHYESLSNVCARIKSGELTSVNVTESLLERISALDPDLSCFARVLADTALVTARKLDEDRAEGRPLGLLHGVPIAVKDLLNTRGVVTAAGTLVMADFIPVEDATVVTRLKQAGAVLIGKTQLTEGAFGVHHPEIEAPKNPWDALRWPGVSSSGSAVAVEAGLSYAALGSDTGGSIRFPAASCGIVGIKPTYGRVSRHGAFPLAGSLDHIGPMTRTVADAARMLQVLAGQDPLDASTLADPVPNYAAALADRVDGMSIGVDWDYVSTGVETVVVDTVRQALEIFEELGAQIVQVSVPSAYARLSADWALTCGVECARAHARYYPARKDEYGPVLAGLIELGLSVDPADYAALEDLRCEFTGEFDTLLESVDLLITPNMPSLPPPVPEMLDPGLQDPARADFLTFTAPFDYSGHPTLTLPAGLSDDRLPRSFQLVGRKLGEPTLIRAGSAFERALGFNTHPVP